MEKTKFREQVRESAEARLKTSFDKLTSVQQSKEMTRFYVEKVMRILDPGMVPDDDYDLENAIGDGKDDCGVDYIYRNQNRVLIIQSKYHKQGTRESFEDVSHFCEVLLRLSSPKTKKNTKLREIVADIDWSNDYFDLHFMSLGALSEPIQGRANHGISPIVGLRQIEDRAEIAVLSETDLNVRLREALSAGETSEDSIPVRFTPLDGDQPAYLTFESTRKRASYLGFISGAQLAELYRKYKYRLFALNIRDYVGDNATNKLIAETAITKPDDFVFFNNGISAVATQVEPSDDDDNVVFCRRFSIINGAQTVRSLWKAHDRNSAKVKEAAVLLRISTFSLGKDPDFLQDVTKYNNTQNAVKISDFRSNDPVQRALQSEFAGLPARGGKPFVYRSKRSYERTASKISIGMEEFAKTVHSFKHGPDDMFGGTAYLFDTTPGKGYCKVFGDGEAVATGLTQDHFRLLAGTWFLCEQIRNEWKAHKEELISTAASDDVKNALERRWHVFWACGELLRLIYTLRQEDLNTAIQRLYKPNWMEKPGPTSEAVRRIVELSCQALIKVYSSAAMQPDFSHRNWFRSQETLEKIRQELNSIPTYAGLSSLPRLEQRAAASTAH